METFVKYQMTQVASELCNFLIGNIKHETPVYCKYHSLRHTLDVVECCKNYAQFYDLSDEDYELLILAATGHDYGFLTSSNNHEMIGADMMAMLMTAKEYKSSSIEKVQRMILSTKIPQSPKSLLAQILCDADLDYLGRSDYDEISEGLYQELKVQKKIADREQWLNLQISFLESHKYHTDWAKENRKAGKLERLKMLKKQR